MTLTGREIIHDSVVQKRKDTCVNATSSQTPFPNSREFQETTKSDLRSRKGTGLVTFLE
jgi:hypothetical protein